MTLTCIACGLVFEEPAVMREHYRSDWHRLNAKRKAAGLPAISLEEFQLRTAAVQPTAAAQAKAPVAAPVTVPATPAAPAAAGSADSDGADAVTGAPEPDLSQAIPVTQCLFCNHVSGSLQDNVQHMTRTHGLFLPDIEYLADIQGLLTYLGEKVGVGHVCLVCNEHGRSFRSREAVQKHMLAKSHCRLDYDTYAEELAPYYDFRASYPTVDRTAPAAGGSTEDDAEWSDGESDGSAASSELGVMDSGVRVADTGYEIILPSGTRAGHRSLARYYKQRPHVVDERTETVRQHLLLEYKERGWAVAQMTPVQRRDQRLEREFRQRQSVSLGVRGNKLFRHMHISTADC